MVKLTRIAMVKLTRIAMVRLTRIVMVKLTGIATVKLIKNSEGAYGEEDLDKDEHIQRRMTMNDDHGELDYEEACN